ncbi:hypothetical protein E3N88_31621 [Mikania micrantha]|uniref:GAG-pre-integrase domain-containing protein n=1 Tax=Mikania micrantha TaxID=192012 RepID=A0A5N6M6I7_9ASTR|nr:hypothetical protein E3N88_31621 [Mikania micrantha]
MLQYDTGNQDGSNYGSSGIKGICGAIGWTSDRGSSTGIRGRGSFSEQGGRSGSKGRGYGHGRALDSIILSLRQLTEVGYSITIKNEHLTMRDYEDRLVLKVANAREESWLWHLRLGDVNFQTLEVMSSKGVVKGLSSVKRFAQIPSHVMSTITNLTQFHGLDDEDALGHLSLFVRICDTFRINDVSEEAVYIRLVSFTLTKFMKKCYPPKSARLRDQIHSFRMDDDEPYYLAWERFNSLLSKCPSTACLIGP